jgi:hypothetical protein
VRLLPRTLNFKELERDNKLTVFITGTNHSFWSCRGFSRPRCHLDPVLIEDHPAQLHSLDHIDQAETLNSHPWIDVAGPPTDTLSVLTLDLFLAGGDLDGWFSDNIFAALQEIGCDWVDLGEFISQIRLHFLR